LPKSTVVLAGNLPFEVERFESEKRIDNDAIKTLLAGDLWKKEEKKKGKKE